MLYIEEEKKSNNRNKYCHGFTSVVKFRVRWTFRAISGVWLSMEDHFFFILIYLSCSCRATKK